MHMLLKRKGNNFNSQENKQKKIVLKMRGF